MLERILIAVTGILFIAGCNHSTEPVPVDNPPVISSFSATPQSIRQGQQTTFTFSVTDDKGLDIAVLNYGDGAADTMMLSGQTNYSSSRTKTYKTSGVKAAELDVFDNSHHKTTKTSSVGVDATLPPVTTTTILNGVEGQTIVSAKKDFAYDPQGLSVTVSVVYVDPLLSVSQTADSIKIAGVNADVNGSYALQIKADNGTASATQTVTVVLAARDDISGRVHDELEGTYVAGLNPELVMKGPLTGWVAIVSGKDSIRIAINSDGTFKFPKVLPTSRRIYRFATNGTDSSFVAFDDFQSGDRVVDAFVSTNAGTDNSVSGTPKSIPLVTLQLLYVNTNFWRLDPWVGWSGSGMVTGMDFSKVNTFYLAGSDIPLSALPPNSSGIYLHNSPSQQDSIEAVIQQWKNLLPPEKRSKIVVYKAPQGEPVPAFQVQSGMRFPDYMWLVFSQTGTVYPGFWHFGQNDGPILVSGDCEYNLDFAPIWYPFVWNWFVEKSICASMTLPNEVAPFLFGKSVQTNTTAIMNFDKKLLYMTLMHLGVPARQYWNLP